MVVPPDVQKMLDDRAKTMSEFSADHRPMKIYAIYLRSLEMPAEKLGSQLMHACLDSFKMAEQLDSNIGELYRGSGHGTKAVMYAKNLAHLLRGYQEVKERGIPHALVIDRGHVLLPHFTGAPIITALGIGPVYSDDVRDITNRFSMTRVKD